MYNIISQKYICREHLDHMIWPISYVMRTVYTECDERDTICVTAGGDL